MGRIPSTESKSVTKHGLSYIRPYHREIARRLVLGQRAADICDDLGMSEGRMSVIVNSPMFKMELKKMEDIRDSGVGDVGKTLKELSPIALEVIERTLYSSKSDKLRFQAAQDVLDRAGHGVTTKSDVTVKGMVAHASLSEIELRKLVIERFKRMKASEEEEQKLIKDADAMEVEFDVVACSQQEQPLEGKQEEKKEIYNEPSWVD